MLRLLTGLAVLGALVAGLWLGGETWAARRAAEAIAQSPQIEATSVTPLRRPDGFGLRLEAPVLQGPGAALSLPWAELSAAPTAPFTARLILPQAGQLQLPGASVVLAAAAPAARLTVAPLREMAVDAAHLSLDGLQLDGAPAAGPVRLDAALARLGHDAPRAAHAGYDLTLAAEDLSAGLLALLGLDARALPGPVSAQGAARLWLDAAPRLQEGAPAPRPVGFQTAGLDLASADLSVRVVGRLAADEAGLAEGRLAVFTRDAGAIVDQLVALEVIPGGAALLLHAGLGQIGRAEFPEGPYAGPAIPAPGEGELRLPLSFAGGQMSLGAVPLGPAPRLR